MGLCIVGAIVIANYKKRYGARLIDLRSSEEYRRGHIEGAVHVPVDRLRQYMRSVPSNQMLIFYCQHGSQSFQEGKRYVREGYRICTLAGGYQAYRQMNGE